MIFVKLAASILALASILPKGIAQNPRTFRVLVGQEVFQPEFLNTSNGDIIAFTFISKTHSVTQSNFQQPCQRVQGGFDSGNITVTEGQTRTFVVLIENTTIPLWVFSESDNDCSQGMVFAANVDQQLFQQFQQRARQTGQTAQSNHQEGGESPGEQFEPQEQQAKAAEQKREQLEWRQEQQATQKLPLRDQLKQQINQLLTQLIQLLATLSRLGQQEALEAREQQSQTQFAEVEHQEQQEAQIENETTLEQQETQRERVENQDGDRRRRFIRRLNQSPLAI